MRQGRGHYSVERQRPGGIVAAPDSRFLLCSFKGQFFLRSKDNGRRNGRLSSRLFARQVLRSWRTVGEGRPTTRALASGPSERRPGSAEVRCLRNYEYGRPRLFWNGHIRRRVAGGTTAASRGHHRTASPNGAQDAVSQGRDPAAGPLPTRAPSTSKARTERSKTGRPQAAPAGGDRPRTGRRFPRRCSSRQSSADGQRTLR